MSEGIIHLNIYLWTWVYGNKKLPVLIKYLALSNWGRDFKGITNILNSGYDWDHSKLPFLKRKCTIKSIYI